MRPAYQRAHWPRCPATLSILDWKAGACGGLYRPRQCSCFEVITSLQLCTFACYLVKANKLPNGTFLIFIRGCSQVRTSLSTDWFSLWMFCYCVRSLTNNLGVVGFTTTFVLIVDEGISYLWYGHSLLILMFSNVLGYPAIHTAFKLHTHSSPFCKIAITFWISFTFGLLLDVHVHRITSTLNYWSFLSFQVIFEHLGRSVC